MNKNIEAEEKNDELFQKISIEFLKALRGDESQIRLSEKIGYSFNQVSKWESEEKKILLKDLFDVAQAKNINISDILKSFFMTPPFIKEKSHQLLADLQGAMSVQEFADHIFENRNKVMRWLNGEVDIPLGTFFQILYKVRNNLDELISSFTSIDNIKVAADFFHAKRELIETITEKPYVIMLIHLLALSDCPRHDKVANYLSLKMKISVDEIEQILSDMTQAGILTINSEGFYKRPERRLLFSEKTSLYFRKFWLNTINQTVQSFDNNIDSLASRKSLDNNLHGFFVLSASERSWKKIKAEYILFFEKLRQIIDEDEEPQEKVKIVCVQAIDSDDINLKASLYD